MDPVVYGGTEGHDLGLIGGLQGITAFTLQEDTQQVRTLRIKRPWAMFLRAALLEGVGLQCIFIIVHINAKSSINEGCAYNTTGCILRICSLRY